MDAGIGVIGYSPSKFPIHSEKPNYSQTVVSSSGNFKPHRTNSRPENSDRLLGKTYNKPFQDAIKTNRPSTPKKPGLNGGGQVRSVVRNSPSPIPRPTSAQSQTPRHHNHNDSYVDETLFGPQPVSAGFKAPWEASQPVIHNFDSTDYKKQNSSRITPRDQINTKRGVSARSKLKYKTNHVSGVVDETLFGPGGSGMAPFEHSIQGSAVKIYSTDLSSSRPDSALSSQPGSARPRSQLSRPGSARKVKHSESFVDETLFGPKPIEPVFSAPWEKQDNKPRPMFCDSSNYTVIIQHPPNSNRPRSAVKLRNVPNILPDKKPIWK